VAEGEAWEEWAAWRAGLKVACRQYALVLLAGATVPLEATTFSVYPWWAARPAVIE